MSDYDYEEQYRTQPKPVAPAPTATVTTIDPVSIIDTPAPPVLGGQDYVEEYRVNPPPTQPGYVNETTVFQQQPAPSPATQLIHQEEIDNQFMTSQTAQLNIQGNQQLIEWMNQDIADANIAYAKNKADYDANMVMFGTVYQNPDNYVKNNTCKLNAVAIHQLSSKFI